MENSSPNLVDKIIINPNVHSKMRKFHFLKKDNNDSTRSYNNSIKKSNFS